MAIMRWMKKTDASTGIIKFIVFNGYDLRDELRSRGFRFESATKRWLCAVPLSETERIRAIDAFLKRHDPPPLPPTPHEVRG